MTKDSDHLRPERAVNKCDDCTSIAQRPLLPVLKLDADQLDQESSLVVVSPEVQAKETVITLYSLLYDKVGSIQKDEKKQPLVFQELCKHLSLVRMIKILPQIDTLRQARHRIVMNLNHLIAEISLDIDKKYSNFNLEIDDLFAKSRSRTNADFYQLNTYHHKILNNDQVSRLNDFLNYGLIEKGGFGSVFKMQNLTDKYFYAVKTIPFKFRDQEEATKIMQEVILYARLPSHQNIVNYKSSWLDHYVKTHVSVEKSDQMPTRIEDLVSFESSSSSSSESQVESTSSSSSSSSSSSFTVAKLSFGLKPQASSSQSQGKQDVYDKGKITLMKPEASVATRAPLFYCVLCIQMELCSFNLRTWIDKRNDDLNRGDSLAIDYDIAIDIFIQIVRGIHHLHVHNLIHRDIKPQNILFSGLNVVKVGDFGLTTLNDRSEEKAEILSWPGIQKGSNRTRGLGTSSYSAPEQQNSNSYNRKADIYSLGLIAFELLYPLYTDMERFDRFDKLKTRQSLPEPLINYKPFADLILETVQNDPEARPEASTILEKETILRHGWKISSNLPSYEDLILMNVDLNDKLTKLEKDLESKTQEITILKNELQNRDIRLKEHFGDLSKN